MKENDFKNSLYSFQQLKVEIESIKTTLANKDLFATDIYLLDEAEVINALKISRSTFYKYRKIYKIEAMPFFGRNVYYKHRILEIILDLIIK